jgi:hypothetical protein
VPQIHADLRLVDGVIEGKIRNDSAMVLESPAVVLGGNVVVLADIPPGAEAAVRLRLAASQFGLALSDKLFGQSFSPEAAASNEKQRRNLTRHRIVDQLTYDPMTGSLGALPSDGAVVLAWGRNSLLDIEVQGQKPARTANVLYYIPVPFTASGTIAFTPDLIRSTVLAADGAFFNKDPSNMNLGQGSVTIAYRPIPFKGSFEATKVLLAMGFGQMVGPGGMPIAPMPDAEPVVPPEICAEPCPPDEPFPNGFDGLPELEVLDLTTGTWRRLPHLNQGMTYELTDPSNYVDAATGTIQIRFINEHSDGMGMSFSVAIHGVIR